MTSAEFSSLPLLPVLLQSVESLGYQQMTSIQQQSLPPMLAGKDVLARAKTGSGKTAAFGLALLSQIDPLIYKTQALVLCPTRELAEQVSKEIRALARFMANVKLLTLCGGSPIIHQVNSLEQAPHIVVGTTGRILDHLNRNTLSVETVKVLVLDEADEMLDMGFIDDMKYILGLMPTERQGMFFSATFPPEIKKLCSNFLTDPQTISVKTRDTASSVEQDIIKVPREKKIDALHDILIKPETTKVIIFRETKRHVDELARDLRARGFKASGLHGDMRVRERNRAVEGLSKGMIQVIVATDVAARGIDIPDVSHVINYDVPSTYDTYIHRIGRTGRGSKTGIALTFV